MFYTHHPLFSIVDWQFILTERKRFYIAQYHCSHAQKIKNKSSFGWRFCDQKLYTWELRSDWVRGHRPRHYLRRNRGDLSLWRRRVAWTRRAVQWATCQKIKTVNYYPAGKRLPHASRMLAQITPKAFSRLFFPRNDNNHNRPSVSRSVFCNMYQRITLGTCTALSKSALNSY